MTAQAANPDAELLSLARAALAEAFQALRWVLSQRPTADRRAGRDRGSDAGPSIETVRRAATTLLTYASRALAPPRSTHPPKHTPRAAPPPGDVPPERAQRTDAPAPLNSGPLAARPAGPAATLLARAGAAAAASIGPLLPPLGSADARPAIG